MLGKEIKFINDFSTNLVKELGLYFTFDELRSNKIHPSLIRFISAEIDYQVFEDRRNLLKNSAFDYSGEKINEYFNLISEEIKRTKRLSYDDVTETLRKAINFNSQFLSTPRKALVDFIFNSADIKTIPEIKQGLNFLYYYKFLKDIILNYFKQKKLITISKEEFEKLLEKIDSIGIETHLNEIIETTVNSIADFFNIGRIPKDKIPLAILDQFLYEKNLVTHRKVLRLEIPNTKTVYSSKKIIEILKDIKTDPNDFMENLSTDFYKAVITEEQEDKITLESFEEVEITKEIPESINVEENEMNEEVNKIEVETPTAEHTDFIETEKEETADEAEINIIDSTDELLEAEETIVDAEGVAEDFVESISAEKEETTIITESEKMDELENLNQTGILTEDQILEDKQEVSDTQTDFETEEKLITDEVEQLSDEISDQNKTTETENDTEISSESEQEIQNEEIILSDKFEEETSLEEITTSENEITETDLLNYKSELIENVNGSKETDISFNDFSEPISDAIEFENSETEEKLDTEKFEEEKQKEEIFENLRIEKWFDNVFINSISLYDEIITENSNDILEQYGQTLSPNRFLEISKDIYFYDKNYMLEKINLAKTGGTNIISDSEEEAELEIPDEEIIQEIVNNVEDESVSEEISDVELGKEEIILEKDVLITDEPEVNNIESSEDVITDSNTEIENITSTQSETDKILEMTSEENRVGVESEEVLSVSDESVIEEKNEIRLEDLEQSSINKIMEDIKNADIDPGLNLSDELDDMEMKYELDMSMGDDFLSMIMGRQPGEVFATKSDVITKPEVKVHSQEKTVGAEVKQKAELKTETIVAGKNEVKKETITEIKQDSQTEIIDLEEPRRLQFSKITQFKEMTSIIRVIFDYDMEDFENILDRISKCSGINEAENIINNYYETNHINPTAKEALMFKSLIAKTFNSA